MEIILSFLKLLAKNNNREWFEKNKSKYLTAKELHETLVEEVLEGMIKIDSSLSGLNPKKLSFRIYRDVRFSKDKKPYKVNMGASFSPSGKEMGKPGYYLHIEPGNKSFLAGGLFMPEPDNLAKVRQEIDYNGDQLKKITGSKGFKKYFSKFWDDGKLKRAPKGYPESHPHIEWLKLKSFVVTHEFKDTEVKSKSFPKLIFAAAKELKPLNDFLNTSIMG